MFVREREGEGCVVTKDMGVVFIWGPLGGELQTSGDRDLTLLLHHASLEGLSLAWLV